MGPFSKLDLSKVCVPVTVQKPIPVRSPREEIEKIHSSNSPATKQKRRNSKESIRASRKFSDTRTLDYRKVGTMHFVLNAQRQDSNILYLRSTSFAVILL